MTDHDDKADAALSVYAPDLDDPDEAAEGPAGAGAANAAGAQSHALAAGPARHAPAPRRGRGAAPGAQALGHHEARPGRRTGGQAALDRRPAAALAPV